MQLFRTPQRTQQQQQHHTDRKEQYREELSDSRKRQIPRYAPIVACPPVILTPIPQSEVRQDRTSLREHSGYEEHSKTRLRTRLDVFAIDGSFDATLLRVFFRDAFGDWESTTSGRFDLGTAVALPSLKLVIDPAQGGRGAVPRGCHDRVFVLLGSNFPSTWEWRRSSRRRCT